MAAPLAFQSLGTRIAILTCFWAAIIFSIPSWLRLTTIQRLPLPARQVQALENGKCPLTFQASLSVLVDSALLPATDGFLTQVEQLVEQSLQLKADSPTAASLACTRWNVEVATMRDKHSGNVMNPEKEEYAIRVASDSTVEKDANLPTVYLAASDDSSLPIVPDTISAAVVAELLTLHGDTPLSDDASTPADVEQDPRVIQYSRHIRLVFSIMNQDVTDTTAYDSWMIHALAAENGTGPVGRVMEDLKEVHDFHVETQVQWFAPLHFHPTMEVLEQIVEQEVDEEVMVDQLIEEDVEVEDDDDDDDDEDEETPQAADASFVDAQSEVAARQSLEVEEDKVEEQLATPRPIAPKRRTKVVKQARTIQVPQMQRVVKQNRTTLPPRHVVEWDDLQVFVNSEEWALTSTVPPSSSSSSSSASSLNQSGQDQSKFDELSQTHDLHFLVYIPSRSHTPLLIRDPSTGGVKDDVNAWLIPQWGGVVILNAAHHDAAGSTGARTQVTTMLGRDGRLAARTRELPAEDVQDAIALFARQLEILLGLGDATLDSTELTRRIRLQTLKHRRLLELTRETRTTLRAITNLVDKILNLGVGAAVKHDTETALAILHPLLSSQGNVQAATLDDVMQKVKQAYELSNRAFFNPDMLGLLYFPDEHKYAVYTPLFAPLLVPLVVTTIKLVKQAKAKRAKRGDSKPKLKTRKSAAA